MDQSRIISLLEQLKVSSGQILDLLKSDESELDLDQIQQHYEERQKTINELEEIDKQLQNEGSSFNALLTGEGSRTVRDLYDETMKLDAEANNLISELLGSIEKKLARNTQERKTQKSYRSSQARKNKDIFIQSNLSG